MFSAWSPSNGKFCSEAQNRKQEANRNDFPNSPKANHCTCYEWELRWSVNPLLKRSNINLPTMYSKQPTPKRKEQPISFLPKWGRKAGLDWQWRIDTQTVAKNKQVPTWMLTLFSELVPLKALFLKGKYSHDSPPKFLITIHGITVSLESQVWNFQVETPSSIPTYDWLFSQWLAWANRCISFASGTNSIHFPISALLGFVMPCHCPHLYLVWVPSTHLRACPLSQDGQMNLASILVAHIIPPKSKPCHGSLILIKPKLFTSGLVTAL